MNKGIVIAIIVGIGIIAIIAGSSLNFATDNNSVIEDTIENESIPTEEIIEPKKTGTNFSVELSESVGLKTP